jgi:hypothetical protein
MHMQQAFPTRHQHNGVMSRFHAAHGHQGAPTLGLQQLDFPATATALLRQTAQARIASLHSSSMEEHICYPPKTPTNVSLSSYVVP